MKQIYALSCFFFLLISSHVLSQDTIKFRDALDFDGYDDRVTVQPDKAFDFAQGTVEAWVQPKLLSGANMIILGNRGTTTTRYSIHMNALTVGLWNGQSYLTVNVPTPFRVGAWYHIAASISKDTTNFYVNGNFVGTTRNGMGTATGLPIHLGNTYDVLALVETYNGTIDEVKFWNRLRTNDEIKSDMYDTESTNSSLVAYYKLDEGSGTKASDATGKGRNGVLYNFALTGDRSNWIRNYTIGTPVATDATDLFSKSFTANWQAPMGDTVTSYLLDVATDIYFTNPLPGFQQLNVGNVLSYSVTGLTYSKQYYYRVRAIKQGIANPGPYSNTILSTTLSRQTRFYVNAGVAGGMQNGANWANAFMSVDSALSAAAFGDTIWVAKGIYLPKENTSYSLKDGVKMFGGFAGTENSLTDRILSVNNKTVLKGNNSHVLLNDKLGMQTELDNFTISGGYLETTGIENPVFNGGGMYNINSSFIIRNCTFINNTAGAQNALPGNFSGGAIYNESSSPYIINCVFDNNSTRGDGGAIFNGFNSSPVIQNSVFAFNYASGVGGAIDNTLNSNSNISGTLFYYNYSAIGIGNILYNYGSVISLMNCTITNNSRGIGYNSLVANIAKSSVTIGNSVIINNLSTINPNDSTTVTYSLLDYPLAGLGNKTVNDPMFMDVSSPAGSDGIWGTADDGLQLQVSSAAVNAGSNDMVSATMKVDILGNERIYDNTVDMGCYEYSASLLPVTLASFKAVGDGCSVMISWKAAQEMNVLKFTIEKSIDGIHFSPITDIQAKNLSGASYSYTYNSSNESTLYIRLKITDHSGETDYSAVERAITTCQQAHITMTPNPVTDRLLVTNLSGSNQIQVYNTSGQQLISVKTSSSQQLVNVSSLANGVYIVRVINNNKVIATQKIMK